MTDLTHNPQIPKGWYTITFVYGMTRENYPLPRYYTHLQPLKTSILKRLCNIRASNQGEKDRARFKQAIKETNTLVDLHTLSQGCWKLYLDHRPR